MQFQPSIDAQEGVSEECRLAFFPLAQPFHGWGIGQIELPARFIGLPMMLKLKREMKPDESGSRTLSQPSQP